MQIESQAYLELYIGYSMFHLISKELIPTASGENPECYDPIPLIIGKNLNRGRNELTTSGSLPATTLPWGYKKALFIPNLHDRNIVLLRKFLWYNTIKRSKEFQCITFDA